ncbi:hypothetical protein D3C85_1293630 [compost metagenome]
MDAGGTALAVLPFLPQLLVGEVAEHQALLHCPDAYGQTPLGGTSQANPLTEQVTLDVHLGADLTEHVRAERFTGVIQRHDHSHLGLGRDGIEACQRLFAPLELDAQTAHAGITAAVTITPSLRTGSVTRQRWPGAVKIPSRRTLGSCSANTLI